ncbi:unnamed protein product, partial [Ectocarpus sp. 12 AP-2014]
IAATAGLGGYGTGAAEIRTRARWATREASMFSARAGRVSSSSPREPSQKGWITLRTLQELEEADERLNNNIGDSGRVGRHRRAQRARPTTASVAVEPAPVPRNGGDVGGATSGALPTSKRAGSSRLVPKGVAPVEEGASDQAVPLLKRMRPDELRKLSKAAAALEKTPSSRTAKK